MQAGTLLSPSDTYVRSFLYPLYTLIKLYYPKALSDPASSVALDWIRLLWRPRIPASYNSATTFHMDYIGLGILQARILEWVAFLFSSSSSQPMNWQGSPALQADSLPTELSGKPWKSRPTVIVRWSLAPGPILWHLITLTSFKYPL